MRVFRSVLTLALALGCGTSQIAAPAYAQIEAARPRAGSAPAACSPAMQSGNALRSFLAANPRLASAPRAQQLAALRARGQLGWFEVVRPLFRQSILPSEMMPGGDTGADDSDWSEVMVPDGLEEAGQYQLAADNPLRLMARFSDAYAAQVAGNNRLALAAAEAALADASRAWGPDNAGLILGHTVVAQARDEAEDWEGAARAAAAGLAVIAAHPRRAAVLAPLMVNLLLIKAEALDRMIEAQNEAPATLARFRVEAAAARADARREEGRHNLNLLSPLFDSAAIFPGMQPMSEWARQRNRSILPGLLSGDAEQSLTLISSGLTLAAGLVPSVRSAVPAPRRVGGGVAVVHEMIGCINASRAAAEAGDFEGAVAANAAALSLVNEQNLIAFGRERAAPNESPARTALDEALFVFEEEVMDEEAGLGLALAGLVFAADGGVPDVARAFERAATLDAAGTILQAAARHPDNRLLAPHLRTYGADLGRGLVYARTALALLLRPAEPGDAATMAEAAAWTEGHGATRVRAFLRDAGIELDYEPSERFFATSKGRFFLRLVPTVLRTFGWASARAAGDERSARSLEADIYRLFEQQIRQESPAAADRVQQQLSSLRRASGTPADRVLRDLTPVLTATMESTPLGSDAAGPPAGEEASGASIETIVGGFIAFNAIPLAAAERRWGDIVRIGQGRMTITSFEDLTRFAEPLSLYLHALHMERRGSQAAALLDPVLNAIRAEAPTREIEDRIAYFISDRLLAVAAEVYAGQGRFADAFVFARLRMRRAALTSTLPRAMGGLGLRHVGLEDSRQVYRNPAEQLIYLATRLPPSERMWDDVLEAFDGAKESDAGDAILLRSLVAANPAAAGTYAAYVRAVAALGRCERPNLPAATGRTPPCSMSAPARAVVEARAHLIAALPERGRALLESRTSLSALRARLRPGELVVATAVIETPSGQGTAILTVSRDGQPRLVASPAAYASTEALIQRIGRDFQLPRQYDAATLPGPSDADLAALYGQLIGPVEQEVRAARHIIWSPDRSLAELPVAALRAATPLPVPGEAPTPYLGLARSISFSPRLNALVLQRSLPARPRPGLSLAVGDIPFTGAAPSQTSGNALGAARLEGLMDRRRTVLAADSIRRFVAVAGGSALTGNGATLDALNGSGRQEVDLLYFYTHGLGNEAEGGPALILAPARDGRLPLLDATAILGLPFQPRYVLLAACNTGSPRDSRSVQPYSGLVRSFLAIGARAVLTAQRQVDEPATALLMTDLAGGMARDGLSPGEALRRAQRRLQERLPNPILWAQFVWVGDSAGG